MNFFERLAHRQSKIRTSLCIGLDPCVAFIEGMGLSVLEFNRQIIDATGDIALAYKPQAAHYAAAGLEEDLQATIDYLRERDIPVILDAKRGDIGATATHYAREVFARYGADAATVNPYQGADSVQPFADYASKGVFVLARTSNPSSAWQSLQTERGEPVYLHLARNIYQACNAHNNLGFVVGATCLEAVRTMRQNFPSAWLLAPGIGAQGGSLEELLAITGGEKLLFNASRSILYGDAGADTGGGDYFEAVAARAKSLCS